MKDEIDVKAQHTPGPWSAHNRAVHPMDGDEGKRFWEVCAGEVHLSPCNRHVSGYIPCPEMSVAHVQFGPAEANARLIAAAPDLLEVLQRFVEHARVGSGNKPVTRSARVNCSAGIYHDARAAIAKATGEQS